MDTREDLVHYLQQGRDAAVWKLEGASEHDVRRPLTPTGLNLLGVLKHLAFIELGYFVGSFGREVPVASPFDQMDVLREGVDGAAGLRAGSSNLPDDYDWDAHRARVQGIADRFR